MPKVVAIVSDEELERRSRLGLDRFDEMWEGVLHMAPPPEPEHQKLETDMEVALRSLLWPTRPGAFIGHETAVADPALWPNSFRTPDVLVCVDPSDVASKFVTRADLVVELRSPDDETYEKFEFYARRTVTEVLVVDRGAGKTELYRRRGSQYILVAEDEGGWLRSELSLDIRWDAEATTIRIRGRGDAGPGQLVR